MKYSVIIPVYNSESLIVNTSEDVINFFESKGLDFELILVNDGSTDNSWGVISGLAVYPSVISVDLLKNYGEHTAIYCGIRVSEGDFVITMDDDGQNPAEEIIHLINKIGDGYDLVFADYESKKHATYRRLGTKLVDYFNRKIFDKPADLKLTNFRIFTREVGNRVGAHNTAYPYIPGLLLLSASSYANVICSHKARVGGKSNYNVWKILKLLARLLFNYSSWPLKILTLTGAVISTLSFVTGLVYLLKNIILGTEVRGWTTLVVLVSFLGGYIIVMLGVIGEYMSRMLNQVSSDQSYYIDKIIRS